MTSNLDIFDQNRGHHWPQSIETSSVPISVFHSEPQSVLYKKWSTLNCILSHLVKMWSQWVLHKTRHIICQIEWFEKSSLLALTLTLGNIPIKNAIFDVDWHRNGSRSTTIKLNNPCAILKAKKRRFIWNPERPEKCITSIKNLIGSCDHYS